MHFERTELNLFLKKANNEVYSYINIVTAIKMPLSTPTKHSEKTSPTRVEKLHRGKYHRKRGFIQMKQLES